MDVWVSFETISVVWVFPAEKADGCSTWKDQRPTKKEKRKKKTTSEPTVEIFVRGIRRKTTKQTQKNPREERIRASVT